MASATFQDLRELREKLLGYRLESVARLSGIASDRLGELEQGRAEPTVLELERLALLYGLDAEQLGEQPITLDPGDAIQALPSIPEYAEVTDPVRARIVAAATAARHLRALERLNGLPPPNLEPLLPGLPPLKRKQPAYRQGDELARSVRERLGLGKTKPIASVRDLVRDKLPRVALLYANLTDEGPAGLTFVDLLRGPTIVLNLAGKNTNPAVRRFSLAHELCHLLVDFRNREPLAVLSGYLNDLALEREQRANAFAVRFLCPQKVLTKLDASHPSSAASVLETYGLHYAAARLYLRNEADIELPLLPPPWLTFAGTELELERAEAPEGIDGFAIAQVPPERRTRVAQLAARAYSAGNLSRDAFADYLGLTPAAELERLLDRFGFDPPSQAA